MSELRVHTGFDHLERIGLDELIATADLQTRQDRKYLVPDARLKDVLRDVSAFRVLTINHQQSFAYESVYFDTAERVSYLGAARRRPRRFKVRTRSYLDTESCVLEVKTRDAKQRTVKHRQPYDFDDRYHLSAAGRAFVAGVEQAAAAVDELDPVLITTYRRTTLALAAGGSRVTIDTDVTWAAVDGRVARLAGWVIVETKTSGAPGAFDRVLWRHGRRPVVISKYGTGLAALTADLPANKWTRVLRQHFDTAALHTRGSGDRPHRVSRRP
jgi:hypothetical protein